MKINFISNVPLTEVSGGFSGMNAAAHEALSELAQVHYVGPVSPGVSFPAKLVSKLKRVAGYPGNFFFYAAARHRRIADQVARQCQPDADLDFFHGFTPWVACLPPRPYMAWSDCCFQDYVEIYHPAGAFDQADLARICRAEAAWMRGARRILLSSEWARLRTRDHYGLADGALADVSIFGALTPPVGDVYSGGQEFLFISTDYARKNGSLCCQAMSRVWEKFPRACLRIIGAPPPPQDLQDPRITYEGYFDKAKPGPLATFTSYLSRATALVHPTNADTTAMIVIEAAFHGCPSITIDDFALPEVTGNGAFAILLARPINVGSLAAAMMSLLDDEKHYRVLRARAREFSLPRFSRESFKKRLQSAVLEAMGQGKTASS